MPRLYRRLVVYCLQLYVPRELHRLRRHPILCSELQSLHGRQQPVRRMQVPGREDRHRLSLRRLHLRSGLHERARMHDPHLYRRRMQLPRCGVQHSPGQLPCEFRHLQRWHLHLCRIERRDRLRLERRPDPRVLQGQLRDAMVLRRQRRREPVRQAAERLHGRRDVGLLADYVQ